MTSSRALYSTAWDGEMVGGRQALGVGVGAGYISRELAGRIEFQLDFTFYTVPSLGTSQPCDNIALYTYSRLLVYS